MNKQSIIRLVVLAGFFGATGCALNTDEASSGDEGASSEVIATAEQPLLSASHAQAFGSDFGTPDFGDGSSWFGSATATGDLDGDGAEDLVVGVPGAGSFAGAVRIFWGQKALGAQFGGLSNSSSAITQLQQPGAGNPEDGDMFGSAVAVGDFNCDGHLDLAVGAPRDDLTRPGLGTVSNAGNVSILYGPSFTSFQLFWQSSAGVPGEPETDDQFGAVLATGNFNGDSSGGHACNDLAIGTPQESVGSALQAGAVTVLYGRSTGLNTTGAQAAQIWHQDVGSLIGVAEGYDGFGTALVAGDFNHDGKDDLAIGVPDENFESAGADSAGLVQVLKGSSGGLTDTGNYALQLNDFAGVSLQTARMGFSLARGDFDHDGDDDLAVGAPFLAAGGAPEAGGVLVYRQISGSLTPALRYDQSSPNVTGTAESDDLCGFSLAAGDFDGDGQDDLSTGCPGETVTASGFAEGALVSVYFGIVSGAFTITQGQMWHKNSTGIPDQCSSSDYFTWSLTAGDFNGDGKADLAAGSIPTTATVNVIYGAP